jgi:hypothetical protein
MFSRPKTTTFVAPEEPIDVNQKYLVRLIEIKDEGVSKYADPAKDDPEHNLRWVFGLYHMDKTAVMNIDGHMYEHHDYSSSRTGKSKSKTAKARLWIEALLGRPVDDGEIDDSLPNLLKDKAAVCLFEEEEKERDGGETYMKLKILKLSPYRSNSATPADPPAPKPEPKPEPVAAGKDLPW